MESEGSREGILWHMRPTLIAFAIVSVLAAAPAGSRWFDHVKALANDGMEGRNTGSPAHKRAADYVAAQFARAGLEPAGTDGYIQPVGFTSRRIVEASSSLALVTGGVSHPLALGEDAMFNMRIEPARSADAPLVFVGYGLSVTEMHYDDLQGLDLHGAVAVLISGGPSSIPGALRAHYQSAGERWSALKRAGAIGTVSIQNPKSMDVPWARATLARLQPAMALGDRSLDDTDGQQVSITFNPAHANALFAGSGHTFEELLAVADDGKPLPRFPLVPRIAAKVTAETSPVESQNVAGVLRGSDAALRNEYVVLSAHLDHVGVGEAVPAHPEDRIYNGAMDNASGVAAILETAAIMRERHDQPKRSILFLAVTGEEKGLLGSRYFVAHPTVPRDAIVANVNTDMFLPLFPLKELMVLGLDESDLGADIRAVAAARGLGVQADPEPNRNRFIRSDQYNFIRSGVPALAMKVGYEEHTPEADIARRWTAERYHAPSDDLDQPIDLSAAEGFVGVLHDLAIKIADRADRPRWNERSFFKRFATHE